MARAGYKKYKQKAEDTEALQMISALRKALWIYRNERGDTVNLNTNSPASEYEKLGLKPMSSKWTVDIRLGVMGLQDDYDRIRVYRLRDGATIGVGNWYVYEIIYWNNSPDFPELNGRITYGYPP